MNTFFQTIVSALVILGTIVLIYFSFCSFVRTTTGKGDGCHSSNSAGCDLCKIDEIKLKKKGNI